MVSLADEIRACTRCPLHAKQEPGALHVPGIAGENYTKGGIAVLCEAPGYYEARDGEPLVGKSGLLFDSLLERAGIQRSDLFLTNTVRCRPPNNRIKDYPEAVFACGDWTAKEFALYEPTVVVLMGATALGNVFGADARVGTTRGTLTATNAKHAWGARVYVAAYHPAAAVYGGGIDSEVGQHIVNDLATAKAVWSGLR